MTLQEWWNYVSLKKRRHFGETLMPNSNPNTRSSYISELRRGIRKPSLERAIEIERITHGMVPAWTFIPDLPRGVRMVRREKSKR